jgi:hypothetical protein
MVQRVYETIPGPVITGKTINQRGDTETVTSQVVVAGTSPAPDGLFVTGTSVEAIDSVKSNKKYSSVSSYAALTSREEKSGLLGSTYSSDEIVDPATSPDALSTSVISSSVQAISATKSKKSTTASSGPFELSGGEAKSGLLGKTILQENIVVAGSAPTPLTGPTTNPALTQFVIDSSVTPIDSAKSKKTTIISDGPNSLIGNSKKSGLLGTTSTTESIVRYGGNPDNLSTTVLESSVTPIDLTKSKKTTIISTGPVSLSSPSKKSGLLGEVNVVDQIVAYGSSPDALSRDVVSSEVTAIDEFKSKKTTASSIGPFSLLGGSYKGGLLGSVNSKEEIVGGGYTPNAPSFDTVNGSVISTEVTPIDSGKSKLVTNLSKGPYSLVGGEIKSGLLGSTSIGESIVSAGSPPDTITGPSNGRLVIQSSVTPIDATKSKKTTIVSSGPQSLQGLRISERGDTETITESIVDALSNPDPLSYLLVSSEVTPIDAAKSTKKSVEVNRYSSLKGNSEISGGGFSSAFGVNLDVISEIVSKNIPFPSGGYGTLSVEQKAINPEKYERVIKRISYSDSQDPDSLFPEIVGKKIDQSSNYKYKSSLRVVPHNDTIEASSSNGIITEYNQLDKFHDEKQIVDYSKLVDATWEETEMINYTFPGLVQFSDSTDPVLRGWNSINTSKYRISRSFNVLARVKYTITNSRQLGPPDSGAEPMEIVNYKTVSIYSSGTQTFSNVLHNFSGMEVPNPYYEPNTGQPKYIQVSAPPSSPSVENYRVNQEILIRFTSERMVGKGGLYLNKATYIITQ